MVQRAKNKPTELYAMLFETIRYADMCYEFGNGKCEFQALLNAHNLVLELKDRFLRIGGDVYAGEQAPKPKLMPKPKPSPRRIAEPKAEPAKAEATNGLAMVMRAEEPEDSHHGSNGQNPKCVNAKRFRLFSLKSDGSDDTMVGEGTAKELAEKHRIPLSTIYRLAGKPGEAGRVWRVERMK